MYEILDAFQTITESSKRDTFRTEMRDKQVEGRTENKLVFSKCLVENTR